MRFCFLGEKAQTYKHYIDTYSKIWRTQIKALYFKKQIQKIGVNPKGLNASIWIIQLRTYTSLFPEANTSLVSNKENEF